MKLLVADDDPDLVGLIHSALTEDGYTVLTAQDGEWATRLFEIESPDLVLLNSTLPKRSGVELLQAIRRRGTVPVVIFSPADDEDQVVDVLKLGADDCWVKPLRPRELRARTHALLRRLQAHQPLADQAMNLGGIRLDPRLRHVTVDGRAVHLSRTEFALLEYLMANHDEVVGLHQLVSNVWGYDGRENENVVKVAISRLRRRIESNPSFPRYIVNVPGVGYMFQHEMQPAQLQER